LGMTSSDSLATAPTLSVSSEGVWTTTSHGGRVLLTIDDDDDDDTEEEQVETTTTTEEEEEEPLVDVETLALVAKSQFATAKYGYKWGGSRLLQFRASTQEKKKNATYFVSPYTVKLMDEMDSGDFNFQVSQRDANEFFRLNHTARKHAQSPRKNLRSRSDVVQPRKSARTTTKTHASSKPKYNVDDKDDASQTLDTSLDMATVITRMLLNSNTSDERALVPAAAAAANSLRLPSPSKDPLLEPDDDPYVMLLVPSASIISNTHDTPIPEGSAWVELGCRLESARFLSDAKFTISDH